MTDSRGMRRLPGRALALVLALGLALPTAATEIVLMNLDGPGEGLNDPTPRAPVLPGNLGDTLGEQRRNAVLYAANLLASRVMSTVPIFIGVKFQSLPCTDSSAGLAFGGPINLFDDFVGQPHSGVFYPAALANAFAGEDLFTADDAVAAGDDPDDANDAEVTFTSALDNGVGGSSNCLNRADWYYGTDHNPPGNDYNFVSTAVHEMIHGLGFTSAVNLNTGAFVDGIPDIFSFFIRDFALGQRWSSPSVSDSDRADSAVGGFSDSSMPTGGEEVVWDGDRTTAQGAPTLGDIDGTDGTNDGGTNISRVQLYAPDMLEQGSSISHWSFEVTPNALMEPAPTGNEDVDVRDGIGLAACVLRDIGWQLAAPCPDDSGEPTSGNRARFDNAPPINTIPGGGSDGGGVGIGGDGDGDGDGGGCTLAGGPFDPVWLLLLLAGAWRVARRRR